jgi:hypothetical protein
MATEFYSISIITDKRQRLNRPETSVNSISLVGYSQPYSNITAVDDLPNNVGETGFNDWGYKVKPPNVPQILNYIPNAIDYSEIISLASSNPKFTVVNTGGILTDFSYTE